MSMGRLLWHDLVRLALVEGFGVALLLAVMTVAIAVVGVCLLLGWLVERPYRWAQRLVRHYRARRPFAALTAVELADDPAWGYRLAQVEAEAPSWWEAGR